MLEKFISIVFAIFVPDPPYKEEFLRLLMLLVVVAREILLTSNPPVIQLMVLLIGTQAETLSHTCLMLDGRDGCCEHCLITGFDEVYIESFAILQFF